MAENWEDLFHKLGYFGTEAGLPTGLTYRQGPYGPFAREFKKAVESRLMNNSLIEEHPRGDLLEVLVGPAYERARRNYAEALDEWEPQIEKLVDLFSRLRTPDAEIASTVHFAARELLAARESVSELDVFNFVDEWKPAKFTRDDVALAIRNLGLLGWLSVRPSPSLPLPAPVA